MTNTTINKIILSATTAMFLTACGSSGSSTPTASETASAKIQAYAVDGKKPKPTVADYAAVGIRVTNLTAMNALVDAKTKASEVDDKSELEALLASLTTDTTAPVITLIGANPQVLTVGDSYTELGTTVTDNVDKGLTATIDATKVDTTKVGTYTVTYSVKDAAGNAGTKTRTVKVNAASTQADKEAPVITLTGANPQILTVGGSYTELGATVTDNVDKGLKATIDATKVDTTKAGTYTVTYNVKDAGGNTATEVTRTVTVNAVQVVDATAPVITLVGDANVALKVGDSYTDAGATATDDVDGDITANIKDSAGVLNTATAGTYTIKYNVSDAAGNAAIEMIRTVVVSNQVIDNNTTVTDTVTGLVWDKNASDSGDCTAPKTEPTIEQFQTILDYTKGSQQGNDKLAVVSGFSLVSDDTRYQTSDGWKIRLKYGIVTQGEDAPKTICVDATNEAHPTLKALTRDAGTNEVTDLNTGLVWSDITIADAITLDGAKNACTANGGMRLPTLVELNTIYDRENKKTVTPFTNVHNGQHWTSTVAAADSKQNWTIAFDDASNGGVATRSGSIGGSKNNTDEAWYRCVKTK